MCHLARAPMWPLSAATDMSGPLLPSEARLRSTASLGQYGVTTAKLPCGRSKQRPGLFCTRGAQEQIAAFAADRGKLQHFRGLAIIGKAPAIKVAAVCEQIV